MIEQYTIEVNYYHPNGAHEIVAYATLGATSYDDAKAEFYNLRDDLKKYLQTNHGEQAHKQFTYNLCLGAYYLGSELNWTAYAAELPISLEIETGEDDYDDRIDYINEHLAETYGFCVAEFSEDYDPETGISYVDCIDWDTEDEMTEAA